MVIEPDSSIGIAKLIATDAGTCSSVLFDACLWNVMFYFHAYRALYDRPWGETLSEFIPQFEADRNELEYAITTAKLVAKIDDTHGFMNSSVLQDYIGRGRPGGCEIG